MLKTVTFINSAYPGEGYSHIDDRLNSYCRSHNITSKNIVKITHHIKDKTHYVLIMWDDAPKDDHTKKVQLSISPALSALIRGIIKTLTGKSISGERKKE